MTKKEFNEFLQGFNKKSGEFTSDEIYEIGTKYKTLPKNDKNWNELADYLGYKNGESLRCYIKKRQNNDGTIHRNKSLLNETNIEECTNEELKENLQEQYNDLVKAKQQNRDILNVYKKGIREEARIDNFKEELQRAVRELPRLPLVSKATLNKASNNSNVESIVLFSDLHLGIEVDNYYNKYNTEIALDRVKRYLAKVIEYCKLYKVQRLNVLNLGDLISGVIHTTLRLEEQIDVVEQVIKAGEILAEFLNQLQGVCEEVVYRSVLDNHSRIVADKNQHIEKEQFGRIIDWFIEERLKDSSIIFAHDNVDLGIGYFTLLNGKKVVFTHGHHDKKKSCFQDMVGLLKVFPDFILMGHYHNSQENTIQNAKLYINGSIVGTDSYAFEHRLFTEPEQKILIFKDNDIININVNLK